MEKAILVPYDKYQRLLTQVKNTTKDLLNEEETMAEKCDSDDRNQKPTLNSIKDIKIPVTTNKQMKTKKKHSHEESGFKLKIKSEPKQVKIDTHVLPPGERNVFKDWISF